MMKESSAVPNWHPLSVSETLDRLKSASEGLLEEEAARRRTEHGPNRLPETKPLHPFLRFLRHFHNVLIYVLLGAAVITALMGHWIDTAVIAGVAVLNALIGFIQEDKAEAALKAIRGMLSVKAVVIRAGAQRELPAEELVPGDIVLLASGDKVPADLRLIEAKNLMIDEASLTGESVPVDKGVEAVDPSASLGDRAGLAYSGTLVSSGRGKGVVVATGQRTELGKVNLLVAGVEKVTTPLLIQIARFGRLLTIFILAIGAGVFLFGRLARGMSWEDTFLTMVGVAVAAIPEGLPAIISITLAIGVQRMARRRAIIRRLPAVETLGSVTVICSDKTGTLTLNEMSVKGLILKEGSVKVSGEGYRPEGEFTLNGRKIDGAKNKAVSRILACAAICNDARLKESEGEWRVEGGPTEGALLVLAAKAGINAERLQKEKERLDTVPFESENKFMATLNRDGDANTIWVKGAPERLLPRCRKQLAGEGEEEIGASFWEGKIEEAAGAGRRVLALAMKAAGKNKTALEEKDLNNLVLLGLAEILDPPRPETAAAVAECHDAGIVVKMITGDHAATALAIAREIGIEGDQAITGRELEAMNDEELRQRVGDVNVYARVSPEDKLRLVRALRARGQVTAMTGDGVNDAPALKQADIGIAMGIKGTEAAKEAAEMVLTDDNFASIVHAVEEGRAVYDNIKKSLLFLLPTNGGEALVIIAALALGRTLPITPLQILWVNMITAVTLAMAMAFEPPEKNLMARPPREPGSPILSPRLFGRVAYVSVLLAAGAMLLFLWARGRGFAIETARTLAVNALIAGEVFYLFNSRRMDEHSFSLSFLLSNRVALAAVGAVIIAQAVFTYLPVFQVMFGTAGLQPSAWLTVIGVGLVVFLLAEVEKAITRPRRRSLNRR